MTGGPIHILRGWFDFCFAPQQGVVWCFTTWVHNREGLFHNMRNDYRSGRKVLHCVVEVELHDRVRALAVAGGVSITAFVSQILEEVTCGGVGVRSGDPVVFGAKSGVVGSHSAGGSGSGPVGSVVGRTVDWDSILAAGNKPAKEPVVVPDDDWLDIA